MSRLSDADVLTNLNSDPELLMTLERNRLATFKDWPFDDRNSKCTSMNLAQAGFYSVPTPNQPDNVKCFVCQKELEGWESSDEPWSEHRAHCKEYKCPFATNGKAERELTAGEWVDLITQRARRITCLQDEKVIKNFMNGGEKMVRKLADITNAE